tara:strand:- start:58 stop:588 length:531 start_codon:yes stop_codon:yes gene_type:complete
MSSFDVKVDVKRNDKINSQRVIQKKYSGIIFSPGPGRPENAGNMMSIIKDCYSNTPMLGICLGHQAIGMFFGAKIIKMKNVMHGRTDTMKLIKKNSLLKKIPDTFTATRYHSLEISNKNLPSNIEVTAISSKNNIMAIKIRNEKIYGLQFHPESISTMYGHLFFKNFILECNKIKK